MSAILRLPRHILVANELCFYSQELLCIVDGGNVHPFGRVRAALEGNELLSVSNAPWSNRYCTFSYTFFKSVCLMGLCRLHVTYNPPIPPVTVSVLHRLCSDCSHLSDIL